MCLHTHTHTHTQEYLQPYIETYPMMNESISLTECATCGEIEERAICVRGRKDGMCECWGAHENILSRKQTLKVLKLVLVLLQSKPSGTLFNASVRRGLFFDCVECVWGLTER